MLGHRVKKKTNGMLHIDHQTMPVYTSKDAFVQKRKFTRIFNVHRKNFKVI